MLPTEADIEAARVAWANHRSDARERTDSIKRHCYCEIVKYQKHLRTYRGKLTPAQASRREQLKTNAERAQDRLADVDKIIREHDKRLQPDTDEGPTTQQIVRGLLEQTAPDGERRPFAPRVKIDPVLKLYGDGKLSDDDLHDAREIAGIFRRMTSRVSAKTMRFDSLSEPGEEGQRFYSTDSEEHYLLLHSRVYGPWTKAISKQDLQLTLGLVVEGLSLNALRKKYGGRASTILDRIQQALEVYRRFRGTHFREEVAPPRMAA